MDISIPKLRSSLIMLNSVQIKHFSVPRSFLLLNSSGKYNQTCATASLENMDFSFPTKFLDVYLLSKLHSTEGYSSGQSKF